MSSLVVDYTGPGRRGVLGFSMGAALALHAVGDAGVAVDCAVVAGSFSSLEDMAQRSGTPRIVTWLLSDAWNNVRAATTVAAPMLWRHAEDDEVVPVAAGRAVFEAKPAPKSAVTVRGLDHDALHARRPEAHWAPVLAFVRGGQP